MNNRNKFLKTYKQLSEEEKEKISMEFQRISCLITEIKKDEYKQLLDGEFENIISSIDSNLEEISKSEDGFWAKYIVIDKNYIAIKVRGQYICKGRF